MLSEQAQNIINILNEINNHPDTQMYIVTASNETKWLPIEEILNDEIKDVSKEYKNLISILYDYIYGYLITNSGQNSNTFYELKRNGYYIKNTEVDSFGPLGSAMTCPNAEWSFAYG